MNHAGWKTKPIDITFDRKLGKAGLVETLDRVCLEAEKAIDEGFTLVVLTDRGVCHDRVAVSTLLACGAVHHHLVRNSKRTQIGVVVETGEAREVHHHCLLIGYGADAINPYLAFESLWQMARDGRLDTDKLNDDAKIVQAYRKAVDKGMLKVMAKMGISTLQSYKGAQIFEALGLRDEVIAKCFAGTNSRIQGCGFDLWQRKHFAVTRSGIQNEKSTNFQSSRTSASSIGEPKGNIMGGIRKRLPICKWPQGRGQECFGDLPNINKDAQMRCALRGLLGLREGVAGPAVPIEEVQPAKEIVKRFCTWCHELRFDQRRSSRNAGRCHEPLRWQEQYGRRW